MPPPPSTLQIGEEHVKTSDEGEDYMSMLIVEPTEPKVETSIQRRARQQRESELKARPKSKAQIAAEEVEAREAALATSLDSSNKGFRMMAKLGFKGGALGKGALEARTEPIQVAMKEGRGGVGMDAEKKRKFREEVEGQTKRMKAQEGDYRETISREREEKRLEGQVIGAMKVAERLDTEREEEAHKPEIGADEQEQGGKGVTPQSKKAKPLTKINILWRGLMKNRIEKERDRRMRYDLQHSLSRLPTYEDPDEDEEYRQAMGNEEEEIEEEDHELDEFNALKPEVRLAKIMEYLREEHHYCFWCKFRYPDLSMDGCPGITEEDHD